MLNANSQRIFLWLLIAAVGGLALANVAGFFSDLGHARRAVHAGVHLRKLGLISLNLVRREAPAGAEDVWRMAAGAVPRQDPWNHEYRMSGEGMATRWASAGPDGHFGTSDDITMPVVKLAAQVPENMRALANDRDEDNYGPGEKPAR